jgi:hypothetical protein
VCGFGAYGMLTAAGGEEDVDEACRRAHRAGSMKANHIELSDEELRATMIAAL